MRIGVDIDSVVCELIPAILTRIEYLYGIEIKKEEITSWNPVWVRKEWVINLEKEIKSAFNIEGFLENLPPIRWAPEAIKFIEYLGYEVVFVTKRWEGSEQETRRWIEKHFGEHEIIFVREDHKNGYRLDALIDDNIDNLRSFEKVRILFDQPWNREEANLSNYTMRVTSWIEVIQFLGDPYLSKFLDLIFNEERISGAWS